MTDKVSKNVFYFCGLNSEEFKDKLEYERSIASENNSKIKLFKLALKNIGVDDSFYQYFFESFFDHENSFDDFERIMDEFVNKVKSVAPDADDRNIHAVMTSLVEYEVKRIDSECCMFYEPPSLETICELLELEKQKISIAKIGARARHKENNQTKEFVFAWLDKHMLEYRSMDDAAFSIAEKVVPMKFRTVRQWITEWKKIRSTGTA